MAAMDVDLGVAGHHGGTMHLNPFLLFDGSCAEAMAFYRSCLGGDLTVVRLKDTPMKDQAPPELLEKVAFAHLRSSALEISATDWQHPTRRFHRGNTVGLYLTGDDVTELRRVFDELSVGADPDLLDPLVELPFGLYGHLADAYGVHWFFRAQPGR
jgi:PhnB protein